MNNNLRQTIRLLIEQKYTGKGDGYNFNLGNCDIYAAALHRLYGYPLYAVSGKFLEPEWGGEREWDVEYSHILVKLPNGNYFDVDGEQTESEILSRVLFAEDVKEVEFVPVSEEEAMKIFSCNSRENDIKIVMNRIKHEPKP
jgi:hypothetical protein